MLQKPLRVILTPSLRTGRVKALKVPVKRTFLFFHMKEHEKSERLPFTDSRYVI